MTTIPGASRFLNAATLSNLTGSVAVQPGLIESFGAIDILDVGRSALGDNGIGLSNNARLLNKQFLDSSASTFNQIFSLGVSETSSIEALQTQIAALRSSLPDSALSRELRGNIVDGEVTETAESSSENGSIVDEEA